MPHPRRLRWHLVLLVVVIGLGVFVVSKAAYMAAMHRGITKDLQGILASYIDMTQRYTPSLLDMDALTNTQREQLTHVERIVDEQKQADPSDMMQDIDAITEFQQEYQKLIAYTDTNDPLAQQSAFQLLKNGISRTGSVYPLLDHYNNHVMQWNQQLLSPSGVLIGWTLKYSNLPLLDLEGRRFAASQINL